MRLISDLADAIQAAGLPILSVDGGVDGVASSSVGITVMLHTGATPQQIADAETIRAAFDWSDAAAALAATERFRARAVAAITDPGDLLTLLRAFVSLALDENNLLRAWVTTFKAEVAAATNLANLQTRIANNTPNLAPRTLAQFRTAMQAKINAGTED